MKERMRVPAFWFMACMLIFVTPALLPAAEVGAVDIHGFVSQGYITTTDDVDFMVPETHEGITEFNEIGINFSSRLSDFLPDFSDNLSIGAQLLAFDFGNLGNNEVVVDWAYGDYAVRDYLGLRAGIIKMPHGLYNETRKIDMLRPSIFLPSSVYPEWFRELKTRIKGVGLYGTVFDSLSYQTQYGHVSIDADGGLGKGISDLLESTGLTVTDIDTDDAYTASFQWETPLDGLRLGASTIHINIKTMDMAGNVDGVPLSVIPSGNILASINLDGVLDWEPLDISVASVEYTRDRLTMAVEYIQYDLDFTMTVSTDSNVDMAVLGAAAAGGDPDAQGLIYLLTTPIRTESTAEGYYGQVAYRVLDNLELGAYYSEIYLDKDEKGSDDWTGWLKETCLSVRYDINSNWCAKVEAHNMEGAFLILNNDEKYWQMYSAKLSYLF